MFKPPDPDNWPAAGVVPDIYNSSHFLTKAAVCETLSHCGILALPQFTLDGLSPRHGESSGSRRHGGDTSVLGVPPDSCADGLCCGRLVE